MKPHPLLAVAVAAALWTLPLLAPAGARAESLRDRALAGDVEAQFELGRQFSTGRGQKRDEKQAFRYFLMAAEQGDPRAQVNVAMSYEEGRGVQRNREKSIHWLLRAAQQGHPRAQLVMGQRFMQGRGVARNMVLAHMWINLGASAGSPGAQFQIQRLEAQMRPVEVRQARRLAARWKPRRENDGESPDAE